MNLRVAIFATDRALTAMEHEINTWLGSRHPDTAIENVVTTAAGGTIITQIYYSLPPSPARPRRLYEDPETPQLVKEEPTPLKVDPKPTLVKSGMSPVYHVKEFEPTDLGRLVVYRASHDTATPQLGRLKSYNNETQQAYVVYSGYNMPNWESFTGAMTDYAYLTRYDQES